MKIQAKNRVVIRRAPADGQDGKPGMTLVLNPSNVVLDTDADGIVRNFSTAACVVQLMRGSDSFAPAIFILQQVRCSARVSGGSIRISSISIDPDTGYSYGSAYVDFSASADGQTFKGRIYVEVNVQKAVARLENKGKEIVQSVESIRKAGRQNTETLTRLSVQQNRILARVSETKTKRYNLLRDTKTLRGDCTMGATAIQDRKVRDFTVASGTAPEGRYLDLIQWLDIDVKPNTEYALSFWARGNGNVNVYLHPAASAHSSNSQGFESDSNDGHSQFTLSNDWQWHWVVFKTAPSIEGKKNLAPFRLMDGASGDVYGVCLVEGPTPVHWLPYNWASKKNYVVPSLAVDARVGDVKGQEVVEDAQMGAVRQLTTDIGNNFQLVFDLPDYQQLNNRAVTMFLVLKSVSENADWHFGGWNDHDEIKGSFSFMNRNSDFVDLGDGWKKYYTTFYNVNNRLWDGHSSFGINSLKGTIRVYSAGVVLGDECPEWNSVPLLRGMKSAGLDIDKQRIELNGRTVFKNDNTSVPLFGDNGKLNPQLSTAQYLMSVLRSMETMIDGGLVIAGLMAAKDGEQVTAYLNGLRQKMHALAAGVKNFGTNDETALSYINFDGSAKFGNLGIGYDGSVNIIDKEGKPRINITPDELPPDSELFKNADIDRDFLLDQIKGDIIGNESHFSTSSFQIKNDNSFVTIALDVNMEGRMDLVRRAMAVKGPSCGVSLRKVSENRYINLAYFSGVLVRFDDNGQPIGGTKDHVEIYGNSMAITQSGKISTSLSLSAGEWQIRALGERGSNLFREASVRLSNIRIHVSHSSGMQSLNLAHNGFASVQSGKQAVYVRDGKLCAFGNMNIPGILIAGTIDRWGTVSNAWGEFVQGASLQYVQSDGRRVARVLFKDELPCGANYVAIANVNGDSTGCTAVVWRKTAKYCDFRVVEINGGEPTHVGLDVVIIGRNHA